MGHRVEIHFEAFLRSRVRYCFQAPFGTPTLASREGQGEQHNVVYFYKSSISAEGAGSATNADLDRKESNLGTIWDRVSHQNGGGFFKDKCHRHETPQV